ncbi:uncharacterized protein LOC131954234, partial [Physella acuta]|uniref:uncharacterized protein LOC131954234 n=1 Tax=Physella acuta TaxID=109671 RepID=UPI0027DB6C88
MSSKQDQDYFVPSEVARLILGYLKEKNLHKTLQTFLLECPDLVEYWQLLKTGKTPATTILGFGLSQILNEFARHKLAAITSGSIDWQPSREEESWVNRRTQLDITDVHHCIQAEKQQLNKKDRQKTADKRRYSSKRRNQPEKVSIENSKIFSSVKPLITDTSAIEPLITDTSAVEPLITDTSPIEPLITDTSATVPCNDKCGVSWRNLDHSKPICQNKGTNSVQDSGEFEFLEKLLEETHLHEKLAENINQVLLKKPLTIGNQVLPPSQKPVTATDMDSIIEKTESDPAFQNFLKLFQHASAIPLSHLDVPVVDLPSDQMGHPQLSLTSLTRLGEDSCPVNNHQHKCQSFNATETIATVNTGLSQTNDLALTFDGPHFDGPHLTPTGPGPTALTSTGPGPTALTSTGPGPTEPGPTGPAPTGPAATELCPTGPAATGPGPTGPAPTGPAPTELCPTGPAATGPAPTELCPTGPAATGPGPTGPAPTGPAPTELCPTGPAATGPGPTALTSTGPGPTGPAPTGPGPTGPAPTGPAATGPGPTGPAPTGPAATGPAPTGPAATGPAPTGPGRTGPGPTGPAPTGPAPTGPAPTGPAATGPAPTGPAPTGPGPTGPGPTGPAATGPGPTGPAPTGPGPTGPAPTGPAPTGPGPTGPGPTGPAATGPAPTGPGPTGPAPTGPGPTALTSTEPAPTGPAATGPAPTGPGRTGPGPTGPAPTGPAPTGPAATGPGPTGPAPTGPGPTGPGPTGPAATGPGPTGPAPTGPAPTGPAPTGPGPTGPGPTGPAATGPAPTGPAPTGPAPTGPAPTGPGPTGPAPTGPAPTGPAPTGPGPTGPGPTGPAATGPAPTGPGPTGPGPTGPGPTTHPSSNLATLSQHRPNIKQEILEASQTCSQLLETQVENLQISLVDGSGISHPNTVSFLESQTWKNLATIDKCLTDCLSKLGSQQTKPPFQMFEPREKQHNTGKNLDLASPELKESQKLNKQKEKDDDCYLVVDELSQESFISAAERLAQFNGPNVDVSSVNGPNVDVSSVNGPNVDVSSVNGPNVDVSSVNGPNVDVSSVNGPNVDVSSVNGPNVDVSSVNGPNVDVNSKSGVNQKRLMPSSWNPNSTKYKTSNFPDGPTSLLDTASSLPAQVCNLSEETSNFPKQDSNFPKQDSNLPKQDSNLPKQDSNLPKEARNLPKKARNLPKEDNIVLKKASNYSEEAFPSALTECLSLLTPTSIVSPDENSPRKLSRFVQPSSHSLPGTLPSSQFEELSTFGRNQVYCSAQCRMSFKRFGKNENDGTTQCKKKVIAVDSSLPPFLPAHCRQTASRRIVPVVVTHSTPSPLQDTPSSPMNLRQTTASLWRNDSPSVCTTGRGEAWSSQFENLGIALPPSPSKRRPKRVQPIQLSSLGTKAGRGSWMKSPLRGERNAPIAEEVSSSQSEVEAFRELSALTSSYTKPQPKQDMTPVHQTPVHQPPVHQTPVHQTPVHQPPVHQTPVHQPPVHQTPVHQTPVHQTPVHQTPVHQTPVHQLPVHQTPVHQTPVHQTPQTPVHQPPVHQTPQ